MDNKLQSIKQTTEITCLNETLGTSIIYSPMSAPSLPDMSSIKSRIILHIYNYYHEIEKHLINKTMVVKAGGGI